MSDYEKDRGNSASAPLPGFSITVPQKLKTVKQMTPEHSSLLFYIPPYTPEMNPIEQIGKEIQKRGFRNEVFATLQKVVNRMCDTISSLPADVISRITNRVWITEAF